MKTTKPKTNKRMGDIPPAQQIKLLKEEIVDEVRAIANGSQLQIYPLTQKGKQLLELEKEFGTDAIEYEDLNSDLPRLDSEGPIVASEDDF